MATFDIYAAEASTAYTGKDHLAPILGKSAVYTTWEGDRLVGTVERAKGALINDLPIVRFADGRWARLGSLVEIVEG